MIIKFMMFTIGNSGEIIDTHNFFLTATKTVSTVLYFLLLVLYIHFHNIKHTPCLILACSPEQSRHSLRSHKRCILGWKMKKYTNISETGKL